MFRLNAPVLRELHKSPQVTIYEWDEGNIVCAALIRKSSGPSYWVVDVEDRVEPAWFNGRGSHNIKRYKELKKDVILRQFLYKIAYGGW